MSQIDLHPDNFEPDDFPIVVAIDFGTTFSPKQNIQYAKTPTLNLYKEVNGEYKMMEWGWKSKLVMESPSGSDHTQISQYKPYLDENITLTPWKNVVSIPDAISDYLRGLHEYAAEKILQEFGPSYSRKCFRYCLTVPAMWSDKAKDVMRRAAIRANIISESDHPERLMLVSEPEAAALYCERACKQYDLQDDDRFMICDAGGGTVDLIVKFGKNAAKFPKGIILQLIETFTYQIKPHFDGVEDQYLPLPRSDCFDDIEDPGAIGIDGGYMRLKACELKDTVFEPVVVKVLRLIQEQIDAAKECSAIFMVGGFGASNYLLERAKQEFSGVVKTIASPYKPEIAVVCGAVYVGMNPKMVTARVSRRCYGICFMDVFQEGVDPIGFKVHRIEGEYCTHRFSVFVKKDQKVQVNECVTRFYVVTKQDSYDTGACTLRIYSVNGQPPRYTTGLIELAEISLPGPFDSSHPLAHEISVKMQMYFGLNEIKAVAFIQGKEYSTTLRFTDGDTYNRPQVQYL
ncbi:Heat shock 70 kDa protein 12A [Linnemannia hyalina]|uniref:Heat shock 70 kDa protein 12A n=1 Tax=Linnemannia hyalina TaxID=64524 RepID=A0A9P7XLX8_9FUNG|nr:Heat shock 70 kDa protein 12A [Linnemannia hyalina]